MMPWQVVHAEWVAAGRPDDIPPAELALLRLCDVTERDSWRERERLAQDADLLAAANTLLRMLRGQGITITLRDGRPSLSARQRHLWGDYETEIRALREPIAMILRVEASGP